MRLEAPLRVLRCVLRGLLLCGAASADTACAQSTTLTLDGWGQTYYPAGLLNLEASIKEHPWVRGETQVWIGRSPSAQGDDADVGDVVVLAVDLRDPTGHAQLRAGRFVLATGAVRPVHVDGGYARARADMGLSLEVFGGSPVLPRFAERDFDWLVGGRLAQRLGDVGVTGVSYLHRRDFGEVSDEEVGLDLLLLPTDAVDVAARAAYDLTSKGLSEVSMTAAIGDVTRRVELFGQYRDPSRILQATSLFSVLSDASSTSAGVSGRARLFPRLRVFGQAAYRHVQKAHGASLSGGSRLALDPEGINFLEGELTRQHVRGARWTGLRSLLASDVREAWRLGGEVEVVVPDESEGDGAIWPWARVWARWRVVEHWLIAAAVEGSASPQFARLFSAMLRVSFTGGPS